MTDIGTKLDDAKRELEQVKAARSNGIYIEKSLIPTILDLQIEMMETMEILMAGKWGRDWREIHATCMDEKGIR